MTHATTKKLSPTCEPTTRFYQFYSSPIGELLIVTDSTAAKEIRFENKHKPHKVGSGWTQGGRVCEAVIEQLEAYFAGNLKCFDLPLEPEGTAFQQQVWQALLDIPYGTTTSYGELARRINRPAASRAVGAANGSNPIPIIIPCHRVIGVNGTLTGYGGGLEIKRRLLELEGDLLPGLI